MAKPRNYTLKLNKLSGGFKDRDWVMVYACFQILEDFFEKELDRCTHIYSDRGWKAQLRKAQKIKDRYERVATIRNIKDNAKAYGELRQILKWWKNYDRWEKQAVVLASRVTKFNRKTHPVHALDLKLTKYLKRVIDLRGYLWT